MIDTGKFNEKVSELRVLGYMISQNGETLTKQVFDDDCRRNLYSASKSFTSAAVGFACQEGLLSLEEKLTDAFAEDLPETIDENLACATVRDLLTMSLGQEKGNLMGAQRPLYKETDWAKLALSVPFVYKPGTKFVYNNVGPYLAGLLVQRRAGTDLVNYLTPRLFKPLGIRRTVWEVDPQGNTFGAGGLFLTLEELHRFGMLYLQDGAWNGKQLLKPEWVRESTKKQVENGGEGYGYLFWGGPHGSYYANGKYCQWSFILRDKNAVITTFAECREGEKLLTAIFNDLYPQL